jgi:ribose transport system ATP-binding protein
VKRIADRVTVLRDGRSVGTAAIAAVSTDKMVEMMSGEATDDSVSKAVASKAAASARESCGTHSNSAATVLVVDSISLGMVKAVSFEVSAGEIFGIAGLVGSGRTELLRAIFGADVAENGSVAVAGRAARRFHHPSQAVAGGLAMVTEDRKQSGLLLEQTVRCNTSLSAMMKRFSKFGIIRQNEEASIAQQMCRSMETRCTGTEQVVGTLSGGNQQKVAIAKWLTRGADVFLFDEPTRGIDVGARRRIYQLVRELALEGKGIVIVSSDLEELFETCDRIAVMSAGRLVDTFRRGSWSEESILQASFAGHREGLVET